MIDIMEIRGTVVRLVGTDIGPNPTLHAIDGRLIIVKVKSHSRWGGQGMARIAEPARLHIYEAIEKLSEDPQFDWRSYRVRDLGTCAVRLDSIVTSDWSGLDRRVETRYESREPLVQTMAESAHEAWMEGCRSYGITSRRAEWGEEFMVPFEDLTETGREFDRIIMRAILRAFDDLGLQVAPRR